MGRTTGPPVDRLEGRGLAGARLETSVPPSAAPVDVAAGDVAGWLPPPRTALSACGRASGAGERSIAAATVERAKASEAFAAGNEIGPASAPNTRSQR